MYCNRALTCQTSFSGQFPERFQVLKITSLALQNIKYLIMQSLKSTPFLPKFLPYIKKSHCPQLQLLVCANEEYNWNLFKGR